MNFKKLWFPWKPMDVQLGTISKNARIGDCYQCALKFRVMPPDYMTYFACQHENEAGQ